jgi:hypothetical protein
MWFVEKSAKVDMAAVKEVFIDATFNTSKVNSHLSAIVAQELGYSVPLGFMLMEVRSKEDTRRPEHKGESLVCNENFFQLAKDLGLEPTFVHTDKDWSEINAAKVNHAPLDGSRSCF